MASVEYTHEDFIQHLRKLAERLSVPFTYGMNVTAVGDYSVHHIHSLEGEEYAFEIRNHSSICTIVAEKKPCALFSDICEAIICGKDVLSPPSYIQMVIREVFGKTSNVSVREKTSLGEPFKVEIYLEDNDISVRVLEDEMVRALIVDMAHNEGSMYKVIFDSDKSQYNLGRVLPLLETLFYG